MTTNKNNQKIIPFLWFDKNAEEAVKFYTSTFKNSKIGEITYYSEGSPGPKGTIMIIEFEIEDQEFMALNGGPVFTFSQAISFYVKCEDQQEIDELWDKLSADGEIQECGWLKDKYGIAWQIIPPVLGKMLRDKNPKKAQNVMEAMLKMKKINIEKLKKAYDED